MTKSNIKDMETPWKTWDKSELEKQYSPSSCVDNFVELIEEYKVLSKASEAKTKVLKNLQYGSASDELLDLFPAKVKGSPLMIFIHGGYWQALSKEDSTFAGFDFWEQGLAYAAIDYTIAPQGSMARMIEQCVESVLWLYENAEKFGFSRDEIYISGSSAGAHLASMTVLRLLETNRPVIKGSVLISGVYDLRPLVQTYVNEPLGMTEKEAKDISPIFKDLTTMPPSIVCWGENETNEFKRQSVAFANALGQAGSGCTFFEIEQYNHFNIVKKLLSLSTQLIK